MARFCAIEFWVASYFIALVVGDRIVVAFAPKAEWMSYPVTIAAVALAASWTIFEGAVLRLGIPPALAGLRRLLAAVCLWVVGTVSWYAITIRETGPPVFRASLLALTAGSVLAWLLLHIREHGQRRE